MRRVHAANRWNVDRDQHRFYYRLLRKTHAEWVCDRWQRPDITLPKAHADLLIGNYISTELPILIQQGFWRRKREHFLMLFELFAKCPTVVQLPSFRKALYAALGVRKLDRLVQFAFQK